MKYITSIKIIIYSRKFVARGTGFLREPFFNIKLHRPPTKALNTDFPETL